MFESQGTLLIRLVFLHDLQICLSVRLSVRGGSVLDEELLPLQILTPYACTSGLHGTSA